MTTIPLCYTLAEYTSNAYFFSDDPYQLTQEGSDVRTKIAKRLQ